MRTGLADESMSDSATGCVQGSSVSRFREAGPVVVAWVDNFPHARFFCLLVFWYFLWTKNLCSNGAHCIRFAAGQSLAHSCLEKWRKDPSYDKFKRFIRWFSPTSASASSARHFVFDSIGILFCKRTVLIDEWDEEEADVCGNEAIFLW